MKANVELLKLCRKCMPIWCCFLRQYLPEEILDKRNINTVFYFWVA